MIKAFIKNSTVLTAYTAIAIPMGYLIRLLYANNLSVSEFGLFYAILSFFGLASVFTDVGFSETQRYFLPRYIAKRQVSKIKAAVTVSVLSKTLFTLLASAVIVLLSTYLGIHFFRMPQLRCG